MTGRPNYITSRGFETLRAELKQLLNVERPHMVEQVATAAAHGDRSENAEYIYGKRKLRAIDRRLRFLFKRIESAVVVDPAVDRGERVFFGATVVVEDREGTEETLQLVGEDEIDPDGHRVSWRSPVGRALLGKELDDDVEVSTPGGIRYLTINEVRYE